MKNFSGEILFLDRNDINTDEIIPARYLTEISKEALKPHLLADLSLEGFDPTTDIAPPKVVVTRGNFGCGSSREHAPWALEVNDINIVIASSFARIFKQNMFNCGMMAVELPESAIDQLFNDFSGQQTTLTTDLEKRLFIFKSVDKKVEISFTISEFGYALVDAGGWVGYANANY